MNRKSKISSARLKSLIFCFMLASFGIFLAMTASSQAEVIKFEGNWGAAGINLVSQDGAGVEVVFSVPSMELVDAEVNGEMMQNVILPGVILPNNAGAPNLPGTGRFIAIPQGASAEFEIVGYRTEVYHHLNLAPAFKIPKDTDPVLKYEKDPSIYNANALYPASPVMLSEPTAMRGVDAVILGITPFQYNPITKDLTVYKDLRVRVSFYGGNGRFGEDRLRSRWWEPILQQNLLNYESLPKVNLHPVHQATDDINLEYVIIVPDDPVFLAWADTLKRWRNEQGIITGITTLTQIGGNDATLIENYINTAYHSWTIPPVAVLLMSDYQSTGDVYGITSPIWNSYCASDNIYADIDANNLPDICLARITAQNNLQLSRTIGKMMSYERTPYTNPTIYQRPLIAAGWQSDRWFVLCAEVVYGYMANELGKTPTRQYAGTSTPPSSWSSNPNTYMIVNYFGPTGLGYIPASPSYLTDWSGNATGINNAINAGTFMVLHRDHGAETGWGTPAYSNSNLTGLTNTVYPYVFSINCLTGKYNWGSECFAEAFHRMNNGALGLIAATEVSYSFVNDAYCWGMWDLMWPQFDPGYGPDLTGENDLRPGFANVSGKYYLQASSWPYNPGDKTVTYHLFHHHGDAFMTMYSEVPQNLTVTHAGALLGGITQFTVTANLGSLIGLSVNGVVIGAAEGTGMPVNITIAPQLPGSTMLVTVTKANYYRYRVGVPVVPPSGPYVLFNDCDINDASVGNNNGQWDFGETTDLSIELKNIGTQAAPSVNATITSADPVVTIIDGSQAYGNINPGDSVRVLNGFRVQAAVAVPDQHIVPFTLTATSSTNTWVSNFALLVNAPVIEFGQVTILDPPPGNNNGALDPGETATFQVSMVNNGHLVAQNTSVAMTSNNPLVTITGSPANYGNINPGTPVVRNYTVTASNTVPSGTSVQFTLNITANGGYTATDNFSLIVGDIRNMPTGPDSYGYWAWDNNDGGNAHPYNWIEIAPQHGGIGTVLTALNGDDQTTQVTLPFTFRYYGTTFTQISVCTNGWLAMGTTTSTDYSPTQIPNADGPPNMVALFWHDLHAGLGGNQIATYYNAAQHYAVVEWDSMSHYGVAATRETFQAILYDPAYYPTSTGDGPILIQYKRSTEPNSAVGFGIENQAQTVGINYGFGGVYDVHAWPVQANRTITYQTPTTGTQNWDINTSPVSPPVVIPANGGSFPYNINVHNLSASPQTGMVWNKVRDEANVYTQVFGPVTRTLPGGANPSRVFTQTIAGSISSGTLYFISYIGTYPNTIGDSSFFTITKSAVGDGGPFIAESYGSGDFFDEYATATEVAIPEVFSLNQNYPNPFNPLTQISFGLPEAAQVKLTVYDIMGREVAVLVNGKRDAGMHHVTFDASGLASGIYLYKLEAGNFTAIKKLILMK